MIHWIVILCAVSFLSRNQLYSKRKDRFEEDCKKQLVGNIVLTRLVTVHFLSACSSRAVL